MTTHQVHFECLDVFQTATQVVVGCQLKEGTAIGLIATKESGEWCLIDFSIKQLVGLLGSTEHAERVTAEALAMVRLYAERHGMK